MPRGGRFGGGAGKARGPDLPFEVDPALEADITGYVDNDDKPLHDKSRHYPPMKVPQAPPLTEKEKREISIWSRQLAKRRKSPYFLNDLDLGKNDPANFNAFEDVNTFANMQKDKKRKKLGGLPDVRKLGINWEMMPKELQYLQYDSDDEDIIKKKKKKVDLTKKTKDRLAKIKDTDEGEGEAVKRNIDDEEDDDKEDDDDEENNESLQDDDFSEDDEDAAGDYNAEQFFDNGEDDNDLDEGGGEDACDDGGRSSVSICEFDDEPKLPGISDQKLRREWYSLAPGIYIKPHPSRSGRKSKAR